MALRNILLLLAVALVALGLSLYRNFGSSSAGANSPLIKGIGTQCAEETLRVVDSGEVVIVIADETDARVAGFRKALKRNSRLHLTTYIVTPDPKDRSSTCPLADFGNVLRKHNSAGAIFFMMDLPPWEMAQPYFTETTGPKLLALDRGASRLQYEGYFQHGRLLALLTARRTLDASVSANPKTPAEWFNHDYEVITPVNFTTLLPHPSDSQVAH